MAIRQVTTPNINISSVRGWCLKYVDDGVNAPARQPSAQASFDIESRNGNIRQGDTPVGVWVPIYLKFNKGEYVNLGHIAWAFNHGDGRTEIHDSEVHAGARKPYGSIQELLSWFGKQAPEYTGWSYWVDGAQIVEDYTPPAPEPTPTPEAPAGESYTVVDEDTLGQIIVNQGWLTDAGLWGEGGDVERVAQANGIADPNVIYPGQVIKRA